MLCVAVTYRKGNCEILKDSLKRKLTLHRDSGSKERGTYMTFVNDRMNRRCVSGRELMAFLGIKASYEDWFYSMMQYGFEEGKDYTTVMINANSDFKNVIIRKIDHLLTLAAVDELILVQPTVTSHNARKHLLELHSIWFDPRALGERVIELIQQTEQGREMIRTIPDQKNDDVKQKTYADIVSEQTEPLNISCIAKDYGLSAIRLNEILENANIQYRVYGTWRLQPDFRELGLVVYEAHGYHDHEGNHQEAYRMKWTQKGRLFIYEVLRKVGIHPVMEVQHDD